MTVKFGEIHVAKLNASYMQIAADSSILKEISDFFSFEVPGAQFSPKVKYGMWDGRKRLYSHTNQTLPTGLYAHLLIFAKDREYTIKEYDSILPKEDVSYDEYKHFMISLNIHTDGNKITPHYFQETSILHCLTNKRATIVSPTSSGKSLIIYSLAEWYRCQGLKALIIVPTVSLVMQMYSDFKDYSSEIDWEAKDYCHKIYSGQEKDSIKPIIISTWQSMQHKQARYFSKFDVVMVDETHSAKAAIITKILSSCTNAHIRYGFTGTLQSDELNKLSIIGLLGPDKKIIGTKQLMDEGYVANLSIKVLMLKYSDIQRKTLRKLVNTARKEKKGSAYAVEMKYIVENESRMKQLISLALSTKGNSLILFQYINHGKEIVKKLQEKTDKVIYYISGETKPDERERIRRCMEVENNIVVVASYGVFSVGSNVKNIHNVLFASPSKSKIKVLQSIGRGLRISKTKTSVTLFDIVDDITFHAKKNSYPNYTIKHFHERFGMYKDEGFKMKLYERGIK